MRIHGNRVRQAKMGSQGLNFHYLNGYRNTLPNDAHIPTVVSHCHVLSPSPQVKVDNHSGHDEWGSSEAYGVSQPRHDWVSALRGQGPIGVLRTTHTTGWSPQVFRLQ